MDTKQLVLDAANALLKHPEAPALYQQLVDVLSLPGKFKVKLADEASVLNPLLTMARNDRPRFDGIIALIEQKRADKGMEPLQAPKENKFDKNEYQRLIMAERRVRMTKAADIENMRRPASGQLVGSARLDFMRRAQAKWMERFDALLNGAFGPGPIRKEDRTKTATEFWATVDRELAESEAAVMRWVQNGRKGIAP